MSDDRTPEDDNDDEVHDTARNPMHSRLSDTPTDAEELEAEEANEAEDHDDADARAHQGIRETQSGIHTKQMHGKHDDAKSMREAEVRSQAQDERAEARKAELAQQQADAEEEQENKRLENEKLSKKADACWNKVGDKLKALLKDEVKGYDTFETGMMKLLILVEDFGKAVSNDLKLKLGLVDWTKKGLMLPFTGIGMGTDYLKRKLEDSIDNNREISDDEPFNVREDLSNNIHVTGGILRFDTLELCEDNPRISTGDDGTPQSFSDVCTQILEEGTKALLYSNGWDCDEDTKVWTKDGEQLRQEDIQELKNKKGSPLGEQNCTSLTDFVHYVHEHEKDVSNFRTSADPGDIMETENTLDGPGFSI